MGALFQALGQQPMAASPMQFKTAGVNMPPATGGATGFQIPGQHPAAPAPAAPAPAQQPLGLGSISTSVQPGNIYSPQQTQQAVNQARAQAGQMADPRWQQKQFMQPGRSQDSGTMQAALPGITGALFQGQQAAAQIPLQDAFANQNQLLQGQIGQQNEANGLSNALAQFNENNIYQQNALMQQFLGPLMQGMF